MCVTSEVTCEAQQLVTGTLTTPRDVTFSDVIDGQCPDGQRLLMDNGLRFDSVKCTAQGRTGLLNRPQSECQLSAFMMLFNDIYTADLHNVPDVVRPIYFLSDRKLTT